MKFDPFNELCITDPAPGRIEKRIRFECPVAEFDIAGNVAEHVVAVEGGFDDGLNDFGRELTVHGSRFGIGRKWVIFERGSLRFA